MDNPKNDLAKMIDAIENLPHHYEEYLSYLGGGFVNPFLSKSIFIADLDLSPRMQIIIISRDHDGYVCENEEYENKMVEQPMDNPKKDLSKMIDPSENLPHHYKEYLSLGEDICKSIPFKEYILLQIWI